MRFMNGRVCFELSQFRTIPKFSKTFCYITSRNRDRSHRDFQLELIETENKRIHTIIPSLIFFHRTTEAKERTPKCIPSVTTLATTPWRHVMSG